MSELGPILGPACASLRRVVQAPEAICAASLLSAASLAVHGLADVHNDGRITPTSLWLLNIAESGERKSAIDIETTRSIREYEKELLTAHAATAELHGIEVEQWEARREKLRTDAKKGALDSLGSALQELGPQPTAPPIPRILVADFTAEGLAKLLAVGRPAVGAFTDEAALVFGGHGMTKESVMRTAGMLCKLWDGGIVDRNRASDGSMKLYGRRLAMHLMAQPVIAERVLSDDILAGQGFLARCLLAWPVSTAGTRFYCPENLRHDDALGWYHSRIGDLLRSGLPCTAQNELEPRALMLKPDASAAWQQVHNVVEAAMKPGGRYSGVRAWASKTPEQCLRIAGVLTLFESADATNIEKATILRAAEIALWHLNEATRLVGTAQVSVETLDAEALLDWCHETNRQHLYSRVALNKGPARIRERSRFMSAIRVLEQAGWATPIKDGKEIDGAHRRHVWIIAPREEA